MTNDDKQYRSHIVDDMEAERRELFVDLINEIERLRVVNASLVLLIVVACIMIAWLVVARMHG